jgi:hypothetical protein
MHAVTAAVVLVFTYPAWRWLACRAAQYWPPGRFLTIYGSGMETLRGFAAEMIIPNISTWK